MWSTTVGSKTSASADRLGSNCKTDYTCCLFYSAKFSVNFRPVTGHSTVQSEKRKEKNHGIQIRH